MNRSLLLASCALVACGGTPHDTRRADEQGASEGTVRVEQHPWLQLRVEASPPLIARLGIDAAEVEYRLSAAVGIGRLHQMPHAVELVVATCDQPRAFWDSSTRRITLCWELIAAMSRAGSEPARAPGIAHFVALHEIGHALIDGLGLPVIGREEDAADAFGALFLIVGDNQSFVRAVVDAARFFRDTDRDLTSFWDEHSFGEARYYSLLCLVAGGSPTVGPEVAALIPASRAERCRAEYVQTKSSWDTMVANATR